jgi:hypothetical protein
VQRIPPSALSRKVTSTPRFSVPSGRTQVSRVAICLLHEEHCSGCCLMVDMVAAAVAIIAVGAAYVKTEGD